MTTTLSKARQTTMTVVAERLEQLTAALNNETITGAGHTWHIPADTIAYEMVHRIMRLGVIQYSPDHLHEDDMLPVERDESCWRAVNRTPRTKFDVWSSGMIRGIASLQAVDPSEVMDEIERRWHEYPVTTGWDELQKAIAHAAVAVGRALERGEQMQDS